MMMMRSGAGDEALKLLAEEVAAFMKIFIVYLQKIFKLRSDCKVMAVGTLSPLLPDHMIREHEHSLSKINEFLENK